MLTESCLLCPPFVLSSWRSELATLLLMLLLLR
jgi:hypothetical protein